MNEDIRKRVEAIRERRDAQKAVWGRIAELVKELNRKGDLDDDELKESHKLHRILGDLNDISIDQLNADTDALLHENARLQAELAQANAEREALRDIGRRLAAAEYDTLRVARSHEDENAAAQEGDEG